MLSTRIPILNDKNIKDGVDNSAKTATNYISANNQGIMVYDGSGATQYTPTTAPTGVKNVYIDSDSMDIRDGQTVLATFGETVRVGKEANGFIEITSDALVGRSNGGSEVFNFATSEVTLEVVKEHVIATDIPFADIPTGFNPDYYSATLDFTPNSGRNIVVEVELYRTASNTKYSTWFLAFEGSTGVRKEDGHFYSFDGVTYELQAEYDGDRTISYIGIYVVADWRTPKTAPLYASKIAISYRTDSLTPCYEIGGDLEASGAFSIAEGYGNIASGNYTHAEGYYSQATKLTSHAEGYNTVADGYYSHAGGVYTIARGSAQTAIGSWNVEDTTSLFIIGNGNICLNCRSKRQCGCKR